MASAEVLDFELLLAPCEGSESPAGTNLRLQVEADAPFRELKAARDQIARAERAIAMGEQDVPGTADDWQTIYDLAQRALATQSKDLQVAGWLLEALVRLDGFAGMRDGLKLIRLLCEQYWEQLYPQPDEDEQGLVTWVGPLQGIFGTENPGTLVAAVRRAAITADGPAGELGLADHQQARDLEQTTDPDERARRIEEGAVTMQQWDQALAATPGQQLTDTFEDIAQAFDELDALGTCVTEKGGQTPDGEPVDLATQHVRGVLTDCRDLVQRLVDTAVGPGAAGEQGGEPAPVGEAGAAATPVPPAGQMTREQAFAQLLKVADFFKRTEPHSPISFALERIVTWGRMPLPDLWSELIDDESTRNQVFRLVGVKPPESEQSEEY